MSVETNAESGALAAQRIRSGNTAGLEASACLDMPTIMLDVEHEPAGFCSVAVSRVFYLVHGRSCGSIHG